jgi:tRNA 2-selenouridine synthase
VDLRSPGEFSQGSIPGALNIPLFSNNQRHEIGLTYKTVGRLSAVSLGVEMFAEMAADQYQRFTEIAGASQEVVVHCARGGMRSQSVSIWLNSLGIRAHTLKGGYKQFRNDVLLALAQLGRHSLLVLDGRTGVGKTDLIRSLPEELPTLDLEGIANHRGSAFGDFAIGAPSPTQQNFENRLANRFLNFETHPKILCEIEQVIGPITLDLQFRRSLLQQPIVMLTRDFDDRVKRLAKEYAQGWQPEDDERFIERSKLLQRYISKENLLSIQKAVLDRKFEVATAQLLNLRYDPVYDRGFKRRNQPVLAEFNLTYEESEARAFIVDQLVGAQ